MEQPRRRRHRGCRPRRTSAPPRRRASIWSIVWPAPIPRSSGGRSAVSTISGTPASSASTTAGCRLAAAEPEVQRTAAGTPVARAVPRAKKPALRSSSITVTSIAGLAPERQRQRGRARAGGDHGVAHAAAGQLLDHRRGQRGVAVGRVHAANRDDGAAWRSPSACRSRSVDARERVLVDLDPEARAVGELELAVVEPRREPIVPRRGARSPARGRALGMPLAAAPARAWAAAAIPTGPSSALER